MTHRARRGSGAPWFAIALGVSIARWKTDARLRFLLLWVAAIALPLCFIGNKQNHYLMPLLPPLALLSGWLIDRMIQVERGHGDAAASDEALIRRILLDIRGFVPLRLNWHDDASSPDPDESTSQTFLAAIWLGGKGGIWLDIIKIRAAEKGERRLIIRSPRRRVQAA